MTLGGQKINVDASYDQIPVFVPAGTILPTGKVIQNTKQLQNELTVFVYGGADAHFTLYEDENVNYNYEKGKYSNH